MYSKINKHLVLCMNGRRLVLKKVGIYMNYAYNKVVEDVVKVMFYSRKYNN